MKTNEIIAGLRKLSGQGSEYRRTVCRLAADKLADYEKAELDGQLLMLPCPIGSKIYIVSRTKDGGRHIYCQTLVGAHLGDRFSRRQLRRKEYIVVRGGEGFSNHLAMDKQGVIWFTDYAAAKAALEVGS